MASVPHPVHCYFWLAAEVDNAHLVHLTHNGRFSSSEGHYLAVSALIDTHTLFLVEVCIFGQVYWNFNIMFKCISQLAIRTYINLHTVQVNAGKWCCMTLISFKMCFGWREGLLLCLCGGERLLRVMFAFLKNLLSRIFFYVNLLTSISFLLWNACFEFAALILPGRQRGFSELITDIHRLLGIRSKWYGMKSDRVS